MVESQPSKLLVAGPIPVSRSRLSIVYKSDPASTHTIADHWSEVHFIQYTPGMEQARSRGELKINSFVTRCRWLRGLPPLAAESADVFFDDCSYFGIQCPGPIGEATI
jgi:hypothetical protein